MKKMARGALNLLIIVLGLCFVLYACSGSGGSGHLYDNAVVKDVLNGSRTEKLGEYSLIEADSEDVTLEALEDWYFNYVKENDFNWCMILYSDKDDNSGVYSIHGFVEEGVIFTEDDYGDYMVGDSSGSTIYSPTEDGKLQ